MTTAFQIERMKAIEADFKKASGLPDRRHYKIFYSPVFQAELLILGLQPRGKPADFSADATHDFARNLPSAASAGFYEGGENDILDCEWAFAKGVRVLISSGLFPDLDSFRANVVVSNLSFVRRDAVNQNDLRADLGLSRSGIAEIATAVSPKAILTTFDFKKHPIAGLTDLAVSSRTVEAGVEQLILQSGSALLDGRRISLFGVAHPSRFDWIYLKNQVGSLIRQHLGEVVIRSGGR